MIVTKTVYLIAKPVSDYNFETSKYENKIEYLAWPYAVYGEVEPIASMEVSFEIEESPDPLQLRLKELEATKTRVEGEFTARITEIQRQINECLAIEG